jgi:hypothetical protein
MPRRQENAAARNAALRAPQYCELTQVRIVPQMVHHQVNEVAHLGRAVFAFAMQDVDRPRRLFVPGQDDLQAPVGQFARDLVGPTMASMAASLLVTVRRGRMRTLMGLAAVPNFQSTRGDTPAAATIVCCSRSSGRSGTPWAAR